MKKIFGGKSLVYNGLNKDIEILDYYMELLGEDGKGLHQSSRKMAHRRILMMRS